MAHIRTISDEDATGRLAKIFTSAHDRAGRVFGIVRLMSLDPAILDASMKLYAATTTNPRSSLPRWFRELIAVRVSATNHCSY